MPHAYISDVATPEARRIFEVLSKLLDPYQDHSERATVVSMAAAIDDQLRRALQKFFNLSNAMNAQVFENNGPLASFGNRIMIAYGLGWFSERFKIDIQRVKNIRNKFAHYTQCSFSHPDVEPLFKELLNSSVQIDKDKHERLTSKWIFQAITSCMLVDLQNVEQTVKSPEPLHLRESMYQPSEPDK